MRGFNCFFIALYQYKKAQDWKKAEFVYQLVKNFRDDYNVKRAFRMLDWSRVDIPLLENEIFEEISVLDKEQYSVPISKKSFFYENTILIDALRNHKEMDQKQDGFSNEESLIRFIFDDFLINLVSLINL